MWITAKWPTVHPDRIQLYGLGTPNGLKVSIALEELALPYEVHVVDFAKKDQKSPEYLSLNPNGKIPAIIDPTGPGNAPLPLWESGAILIYLGDKTGQLLPTGPARYEAIQWVMFQMSAVGPMIGQVGFFTKFAGKDIEDKRPRDHYVAEVRRLLGVLDGRYAAGAWLLGGAFTIADISVMPWISALTDFYAAGDLVGFGDFKHVARAQAQFAARPAVQRGLKAYQLPG